MLPDNVVYLGISAIAAIFALSDAGTYASMLFDRQMYSEVSDRQFSLVGISRLRRRCQQGFSNNVTNGGCNEAPTLLSYWPSRCCARVQSPLASHHSPARACFSPAGGSVAVSDWRNSSSVISSSR